MHVKYLAGIVGAALLMAGCSSSNELTCNATINFGQKDV